MTFSMPKHIAVAIAGGAIAVALGVGVIFLGRGSENDPADILPADQTVALLRNADRGSMLTLQTYVTGFDAIALPDHPVDVALLTLPNGTPAWAIFDARTAPVGMRFSISASDASVQSMIGAGENRLSDLEPYRALKGFLLEGPSAYLRFPGINLKPATSISSLFTPSQPVAIQFKADATHMVLPEGDTIESLSSALLPSVRTLIQSRIRTVATSLFGTALSPTYDIFPLVERNTIVRLAGPDSFFIAGRAGPSLSVRDGIEKLHEAFGSAKAGVEIVELPLDDQFSYTGVRLTDDAAEHTSESKNGFTIETSTRSGANGLLLTAVQGSSVVIANTQESLQEGMMALMGAEADSALSISADDVAARKLLPDAKAGILWNVVHEGGRLLLEIK